MAFFNKDFKICNEYGVMSDEDQCAMCICSKYCKEDVNDNVAEIMKTVSKYGIDKECPVFLLIEAQKKFPEKNVERAALLLKNGVPCTGKKSYKKMYRIMRQLNFSQSRVFYSNCFFEAVKAKLRDPKNIRMVHIPKKLCTYRGPGHWYYYDVRDPDWYYDFSGDGGNGKQFLCKAFFSGTITKRSRKSLEQMLNLRFADNICRPLEKKYGIKLLQTSYSVEEDITDLSCWDQVDKLSEIIDERRKNESNV